MVQAFTPQFTATLSELLAWRRDVRRFRRDALDEDVLASLFSAAQLAPSVGNSQPWRFVRVRSDPLREALAHHVDSEVVTAGSRLLDQTKQDAYAKLKLHGLHEAPEIIAVFCDESTRDGSGLGAATMPETRTYSVVLAIHNLWPAARARGLAVGWVSILKPDYVCALLNAPSDWRFIAVLCLGWPEAPSGTPELERLGWQSRNSWERHVSVV